MNTLKTLLIMVFVISFFTSPLYAQEPVNAEEDFREVLQLMDKKQKLKLLEVAFDITNQDVDNVLIKLFKEQAPAEQEKIQKQAEEINLQNGQIPNTTCKWEETIINFGDIVEGINISTEFKVTNTGQHPLYFKSAETTCRKCVKIHLPKAPIAPGETVEIMVTFKSEGKFGMINQSIVIKDNTSPNMRNILNLRGNVRPAKNNPGVKIKKD